MQVERERQAGSQDFIPPALGTAEQLWLGRMQSVKLRGQEENPALITSFAFYVCKLSCGKTCSYVETAFISSSPAALILIQLFDIWTRSWLTPGIKLFTLFALIV